MMNFKEKVSLIRHLKRNIICIAIESEKSQEELLKELNKKEGIECEKCKKTYKNANSLRMHIKREHITQ